LVPTFPFFEKKVGFVWLANGHGHWVFWALAVNL
jgi:hypothetical protein